jgi:hypothetical protein
MKTSISNEDTTVIMTIENIIQKEFTMSKQDIIDLYKAIQAINTRLSRLEGKFFIVSAILGVLGLAMLNYLMDILKMLQIAGG